MRRIDIELEIRIEILSRESVTEEEKFLNDFSASVCAGVWPGVGEVLIVVFLSVPSG